MPVRQSDGSAAAKVTQKGDRECHFANGSGRNLPTSYAVAIDLKAAVLFHHQIICVRKSDLQSGNCQPSLSTQRIISGVLCVMQPNKPRIRWISIFIALLAVIAVLLAIYTMMDGAVAALMSAA
jgi:hypothetical protein